MKIHARTPLPSGREALVVSSAAPAPAGARRPYRRVALLEVEPGAAPAMISLRARGVLRVVDAWERLSVGSSPRCAFARALRAAGEAAAALAAPPT